MTGFVSEQGNLRQGDYSKYGYWSWEDRAMQTRTDEVMTVGAAWRGDPCGWNCGNNRRGRENGNTYRQRWENARKHHEIDIAFVPSFN